MTKCITLGFWLWGRPWLLVLCTEVTYGKGSLLTERKLDMSAKTTFKFINPQRACARGLQYSHFVCHSLFDFGEGAVFRVETYIDTFYLSVLNVALF